MTKPSQSLKLRRLDVLIQKAVSMSKKLSAFLDYMNGQKANSGFTEDFKKDSDYYDLNRCIAINIVNEPFKLNESMHSIYKILETETHKLLDEVLEIHFLDLTKIPQEERSKLEDWLLFIQTEEQEVRDMLSKKDNQLKRANSQMQEFYSVDEQRAEYIRARNAESDRASLLGASHREGFALGVAQGKQEGKLEGVEEIASALKKMGLPTDQIIKATKLSLEEVEKL